MRRAVGLIIACSMLLGNACASIVSKSEWPVDVTSNPPGAMCIVRNEAGAEVGRATTPASFMLKSGDGYFHKASYRFSFEKEGYQPVASELTANMNGWYWGNIIFGGLIGMLIVDPATGAMWKLDESVSGTMTAQPAAASTATVTEGPSGEAPAPAAPPAGDPAEQPQDPAKI